MIKKKDNITKWNALGGVLFLGLIVYLVNMTNSGLWYDEAIEYYYSRFSSGPVPGGRNTMSMYERICSTYQPPLYNWLMHVWLICFDSEFGFRLAGVLITLAGAVAIYLCLEKLTNYKWATAGTLVYLFTSTVSYYALECAEYNLMLCCIAWTLYFYMVCLKDNEIAYLIGFFVFASMSVYSQYGATFLVMAMYISLIVHFSKEKKFFVLKRALFITLIVGVIVVAPLIWFFLIPQIINQGTAEISHMPVFTKNIIYDIGVGLWNQIYWCFTYCNDYFGLTCVIVMVSGVATIFSILFKEKELYHFLWICFISWLLYFMAIICSFYGYNNWQGSVGSNNIGNRYGLFFVPLWVLVLVYGLFLFVNGVNIKYKNTILSRVIQLVIYMALLGYLFIGMHNVAGDWNKDDIREVTERWYENKGYTTITLVHQWSDATFQYYLIHNEDYKTQYQNNIITADNWIRNAEYRDIQMELDKMNIFELEGFYYIGPTQTYKESFEAFEKVMRDNGYRISYKWKGKSALLYLNRK